jgi:amino-acid N-acetyltransferase
MQDKPPNKLKDETVVIERAQSSDLASIQNLLTDSSLPLDGVSDHIASALVVKRGKIVIGCAALELYDTAALLRSMAVAEEYRGQGLGQRLTREILNLGKQKGVTDVYLLTETAGEYFPKFGFHPVDRSKVPAAVQTSVEFTSACPASALAMKLSI